MEEALRTILALEIEPEARLVYMCLAEESFLCVRDSRKPKKERTERKALAISDICERVHLSREVVIKSLNCLQEEEWLSITVLDSEREIIYANLYSMNEKLCIDFGFTSRNIEKHLSK